MLDSNRNLRLIVTGATGFVGSEVVAQLERRADVAHVTCLSRRSLARTSTKIETVLQQDFTVYDDALVRKLAEHDGCIWALGGKASDSPSLEDYTRTTYAFTLSLARALASRVVHPFRFVYLSGMGADPTESAWLPWERTTRHLKGRVERSLRELTQERALFRATSFRPGGILERDTSRVTSTLFLPIAVPVERLAQAMIDEIAHGAPTPFRVVSNRAIRRH